MLLWECTNASVRQRASVGEVRAEMNKSLSNFDPNSHFGIPESPTIMEDDWWAKMTSTYPVWADAGESTYSPTDEMLGMADMTGDAVLVYADSTHASTNRDVPNLSVKENSSDMKVNDIDLCKKLLAVCQMSKKEFNRYWNSLAAGNTCAAAAAEDTLTYNADCTARRLPVLYDALSTARSVDFDCGSRIIKFPTSNAKQLFEELQQPLELKKHPSAATVIAMAACSMRGLPVDPSLHSLLVIPTSADSKFPECSAVDDCDPVCPSGVTFFETQSNHRLTYEQCQHKAKLVRKALTLRRPHESPRVKFEAVGWSPADSFNFALAYAGRLPCPDAIDWLRDHCSSVGALADIHNFIVDADLGTCTAPPSKKRYWFCLWVWDKADLRLCEEIARTVLQAQGLCPYRAVLF